MSWAVGYSDEWRRDIGYGVPAACDHPGCGKEINRGLAYLCGGCALYFCEDHRDFSESETAEVFCERCAEGGEPFEPTPDLPEWTRHKATDPSWAAWREGRDEEPD